MAGFDRLTPEGRRFFAQMDELKKLSVHVGYQAGVAPSEPNAPSTIRKKGSDKPLIDTGRLRQSVNYVIKPKGGD